ncbi:glycosyltransferase [candidate division KSB1 bacterium]|nr:glycosyltransferase [candidate division KSB1 bacterium]
MANLDDEVYFIQHNRRLLTQGGIVHSVLLFSVICLIFILCITWINLLFGPYLRRRAKGQADYPMVSVLIPARNEGKVIAHCIESMLKQNYPKFEIIVLNDNSSDDTEAIIQNYAHKYPQVQYIRGEKLPPGWLGKNWACHQLAQRASGDIYIFTDADNIHETYSIDHTVSYIQHYTLGMFSAFPQQITVTMGEKLIVPIIDLFVYGTLPLWATYYFQHPSLAAANGQWIAFTKDAYKKIGGHEAIKQILVEDTTLNRLAKERGIKTLTSIGTKSVYCRMYHNWREVWSGFTRHYYGLTGNNDVAYAFITLISLLIFVLPYITVFIRELFAISAFAIGLNVTIRLIQAVRYKHPVLISVILHPLAILSTTIIGFNSFLKFKKGSIQWKDRTISMSD